MDFIIGLSVFIYLKGESFDLILVIIDRLIIMIYYKSVKVILYAFGLIEVIIKCDNVPP